MLQVGTFNGTLELMYDASRNHSPYVQHRTYLTTNTSDVGSIVILNGGSVSRAAGFGYFSLPRFNTVGLWCPIWILVIVTAIYPAVWLRGWRRRRHHLLLTEKGCGFPVDVVPGNTSGDEGNRPNS